jgi:hypothetical protein
VARPAQAEASIGGAAEKLRERPAIARLAQALQIGLAAETTNGQRRSEWIAPVPTGSRAAVDLGTLQALPGRGLARAGDLHVLEEKGHRRREPGAVTDLPVALLEADELARSGEIVTIGVQFVEQIDQASAEDAAPRRR